MNARTRAVLVAVLTGLLLTLLPGVATANSPIVDDPCVNNPSQLCEPPKAKQSNLLPVNRWSDATGQMHSRLGQAAWQDLPAKIQRSGTYPVLISLGNSMWSGATSVTSAAISMDVLDSAGAAADQAAAKLGQALWSSGVLVLLLVVSVIVTSWRAMRSGGGAPWRAIAKAVAIASLFAVMMNGAAASTTVNGNFRPGFMSPGWWVTVTNDVIAAVASAPAAALTVSSDVGAGYVYAPGSTGDLSCQQYVAYLKNSYIGGHPLNRVENSVPLVMSSMWEATGLKVWSVSQFGGGNPYGDFAYCRLLEQQAGIPPALQAAYTMNALGPNSARVPQANRQSLAWQTAEDVQTDRTMVAWGQCRWSRGGWTQAPGWSSVSARGKTTSDVVADCDRWWTRAAYFVDSDESKFSDGQSAFNWDGRATIVKDAQNAQVRNYMLSLQGHTGGATASMALVYTYVLSALIVSVVFFVMAVSIIIAKLSALVMMMATFFALLLSLWPNNRGSSVGKFFGQYVGMAILVFGIQLVFAFLTLTTSMLIQAGVSIVGGDHVLGMIWTGLSPVAAVWLLHLVFKKFLKVPSPFTFDGAQQWGAAASGGAIGGVLGAGIASRMQRMGGVGKYAMMRAGERAGHRAVSGMRTRRAVGAGAGGHRPGALVGATVAAAGIGAAGAAAGPGGKGATVTTRPGRRGAGPATVADKSATENTPLTRAQVKAQRAEASKARTRMESEYAAARGKTYTGSLTDRARVGVEMRMDRMKDAARQYRERPIRKSLEAARGPAARTALKAGVAGAAVVGTGGLAAPVVAAVWGTKRATSHRQRRAELLTHREGHIKRFMDAKAQEAASAAKQTATTPVGAGRSHLRAVAGTDGATTAGTAGRAGAFKPSPNGQAVEVTAPQRVSVRDRAVPTPATPPTPPVHPVKGPAQPPPATAAGAGARQAGSARPGQVRRSGRRGSR